MPGARRSADLPVLSKVLSILGNDSRLEILRLLSGEPMDVSTMTMRLGINMPMLSHSLGMLRHNGIVLSEAVGTRRIYHLAAPVTVEPCSSTLRTSCLRIRCRDGAELVLKLPRSHQQA